MDIDLHKLWVLLGKKNVPNKEWARWNCYARINLQSALNDLGAKYLLILRNYSSDGSTNCGLSTDGPNPTADKYIACKSKLEALETVKAFLDNDLEPLLKLREAQCLSLITTL